MQALSGRKVSATEPYHSAAAPSFARPIPAAGPHAQAHLAAIIESSDDAIISKTLDGIILSWNRGAERIFGYTPGEAIGRSVSMLVPADRKDEETHILDRIRRGERVEHFETVRLAKAGRCVEVSLTISPVRDASGQIIGISKIARDITSRKNDEQRFRNQAAELTRSNDELDRFASIASHDLLEPLRTVATFTEFLQWKIGADLDAEGAEYFRFMVEGVERMQALLNDLLAYARISSRARPVTLVDCNQVVEKAMENLLAAIHSKQAQIAVEPLPKVPADASQLGQVFQNLISNALKFCTQQQPRIRISALQSESEWVFAIEDNGIGIAEKHFRRIFDIFQRLHTAEEYPGTGVGLSICKKIIDRHHGRMWLESIPGDGSTFFFSIPNSHG
ncbi:MAG TPA: PAS domain S-box protein [Tepidisphaeraceae bacterium]|nr:PAS domain S-box protein [Tepidisphaeraceae bacterium]